MSTDHFAKTMSSLVSYGGDDKVVATRGEIERIAGSLGVVQSRLFNELQPLAQLNGIIHHIQLDLQLPETFARLGLQRTGCYVASESYFSGDAQVAHVFDGIATQLHDNPWISKLVPSQAWLALGATAAVAAFGNTNFTSLVARATAGQVPLNSVGSMIQALPMDRVQVHEQVAKSMAAPTTLAALSARLNNTSGNIRIEGYQTANGRVVFVYLPGTADWAPIGGKKAFDLKSDIALAANVENSNSIRAAHAAMNAYGVKDTDRLVVVGYSQGGMVAAKLAGENPNVIGVVTLGSPITNADIPSSTSVVSIEHSNDLVPALAGDTNPLTENWVTASRHLDLKPGQSILEAHSIGNYVDSAKMADSSGDIGLIRQREKVLASISGSTPLAIKEYQPLKAAS